MKQRLQPTGKATESSTFPAQATIIPPTPQPTDPRDKRPTEIEDIRDDDLINPKEDPPVGDQKPDTQNPIFTTTKHLYQRFVLTPLTKKSGVTS